MFNEAILSLSTLDVLDFFLEEEPIEVAETFGIAPAGLKLEASSLEDYELASKAFSDFLYPVDMTKLLIGPYKIKR